MRGSKEIQSFPDPIPVEVEDELQHYSEGLDENEKFLPSKLQEVSKQPHNVPFTPTVQTAKNVAMVIKCTECKKCWHGD